jgi:hypothetical protein
VTTDPMAQARRDSDARVEGMKAEGWRFVDDGNVEVGFLIHWDHGHGEVGFEWCVRPVGAVNLCDASPFALEQHIRPIAERYIREAMTSGVRGALVGEVESKLNALASRLRLREFLPGGA